MKYLLRTHNFFKNLSTPKFIIIMTLLTFVILIPLEPILSFLDSLSGNPTAGPEMASYSLIHKILSFCLIAPIFETLIFQTFIISELRKIKKLKKNTIIIILISALFFGLSHYYNISYIFATFIVGILFAYSYVLYENKVQSPFWVVSGIHALRNFISIFLLYFY